MKTLLAASLTLILFFSQAALADGTYNRALCNSPGLACISVRPGITWDRIVPDLEGQALLKLINDIDGELQPGMIIALPSNLNEIDLQNVIPFGDRRRLLGCTAIIVCLNEQAVAAYDSMGRLQYWGPIYGGKYFRPNVGCGCPTSSSTYYIASKEGPRYAPSKYFLRDGGIFMPSCLYVLDGSALHRCMRPYNRGCYRGCYCNVYDMGF